MNQRLSRGFTLLELLVAITVLSIVSMIAWRGLDSLVATRERLEPEVDDIRSLLTTFGQMERDLTQVTNPVFLGLAFSPLNIGVADGGQVIELARVASPVADRATEVQTVFYRVVDGSLVRQATPPLPAFDRANAESFETARLMNNVQVDERACVAGPERLGITVYFRRFRRSAANGPDASRRRSDSAAHRR